MLLLAPWLFASGIQYHTRCSCAFPLLEDPGHSLAMLGMAGHSGYLVLLGQMSTVVFLILLLVLLGLWPSPAGFARDFLLRRLGRAAERWYPRCNSGGLNWHLAMREAVAHFGLGFPGFPLSALVLVVLLDVVVLLVLLDVVVLVLLDEVVLVLLAVVVLLDVVGLALHLVRLGLRRTALLLLCPGIFAQACPSCRGGG